MGDTSTSLNIIDVGANIGCCSIRLAMLGHKVLSFEPVEANYELFERSVQLNNVSELVTIIKAGASDINEKGTAIIEAGNAGNSLVLNHREYARENTEAVEALVRSIPNSTFSRTPVALQQLEPHLARLGRVHLLKLDCQGCEPAALRGAGRSALDAGQVRNVVMEFSPGHLRAAGEDPVGLLEGLAARGFGLATLVMGTHIPPARFRSFAARSAHDSLLLHARHATAGAPHTPLAPAAAGAAAAAAAACLLAAWWGWRGRPATRKTD
jgi:FkbM family methyltransferase